MLRLGLIETLPAGQVSVQSLTEDLMNFHGGKIKEFFHNWCKLTSDSNILTMVKSGVTLNFIEQVPTSRPIQIGYAQEEHDNIERGHNPV